jgi:ATPase subunit of ABC transporter with duplicated ATPase domains
VPAEQNVTMRLRGGRTGKRAVVCEQLELTGLMKPFDLEVWFGERVAVLGSNGSGKSHFLRLLAAGGSRPGPRAPAGGRVIVRRGRHTGVARLGARVRPGWFARRTSTRADRPHAARRPAPRRRAPRRAAREEPRAGAGPLRARPRAEQTFDSLSGGQQARLPDPAARAPPGATLLLLDEPTDNPRPALGEALEQGLAAFEGTVVAVTHDRWFTRSFDRFLVFGADGRVYESSDPVWDERGSPGNGEPSARDSRPGALVINASMAPVVLRRLCSESETTQCTPPFEPPDRGLCSESGDDSVHTLRLSPRPGAVQ